MTNGMDRLGRRARSVSMATLVGDDETVVGQATAADGYYHACGGFGPAASPTSARCPGTRRAGSWR
jgi:hypothetical protein